MSKTILEVESIKKSFGEFQALKGVDIDIKEGEIVGLIGPNGCGKSTTFNVISGMLKQDDGSIKFKGQSIEDLPPHEINELGLARTFQYTRLWLDLTVIDNLLLPPKNQSGNSLFNLFFKSKDVNEDEESNIKRAREILKLLEIDHMVNNYCSELSGGQSKLVDLGRILMNKPDILLLDEPTAGVAPPLAEKIFEHIHQLNEEQGISVVIIEHNMDFILRAEIDRIFVMSSGKIIADGPPDEIQENQKVLEAYLGM